MGGIYNPPAGGGGQPSNPFVLDNGGGVQSSYSGGGVAATSGAGSAAYTSVLMRVLSGANSIAIDADNELISNGAESLNLTATQVYLSQPSTNKATLLDFDSVITGDGNAGTSVELLANGGINVNGNLTKQIVGSVFAFTNAVLAGAVAVPYDNTIPQQSEGFEFLTATITPKSALNKLRVEVTLNVSSAAAGYFGAALFRDATANAVAATNIFIESGAGTQVMVIYEVVAGSTAATTFKARAGTSAGSNITMNGVAGAGIYGGVQISGISILETTP